MYYVYNVIKLVDMLNTHESYNMLGDVKAWQPIGAGRAVSVRAGKTKIFGRGHLESCKTNTLYSCGICLSISLMVLAAFAEPDAHPIKQIPSIPIPVFDFF